MLSQPTMLCAKTLTFDLATNQGLSNQIEAGKQAPCLGLIWYRGALYSVPQRGFPLFSPNEGRGIHPLYGLRFGDTHYYKVCILGPHLGRQGYYVYPGGCGQL